MKRTNLARAASAAVFVAVMASASAAFAASSLVTETAVATTTPTNSSWSDSYEGKIVYGERTGVSSYDIWLYDSATGSKKAIAASTKSEHRPRIWGDYVVYNLDQESIRLYRISTGKTKTIASKKANSTVVDIYRDKVVYSKDNSTNTNRTNNDVYLYDIDTGKETRIINSKVAGLYADDRVQAIWGNNVVYVVNYQDLRVYNLSTKKSASLNAAGYSIDGDAANAGDNRPAIYQNTVVYTAPASGYMQVFTYDLASKTRTQISQDATPHAAPAIYGNRVVYDRGSLANKELVIYDTRTKGTWALNIGPSMQASIWGDRLAWTDMRNGTHDDEHDDGADWHNKDLYTGTLNTLKIKGPASMNTPFSTPTTLTATVKNPDGSSVGTGTVVGWQVSSDGIKWSDEGTATTEGGVATVVLPKISFKRYIRFTYDGTAELPATVSPVFTVTPAAYVGAPVAPATMKVNKSKSVYGSLKPQHASGTVRIYKYKKVNGKWKGYGYTNAKVYKYKDRSRYRANVKLTSKGSWRLRAYENPDSKHAEAWSGYDYVTVK